VSIVLTTSQSPIILALRNIYFHPLSQYPGPKGWCAFRFRYCYSLCNGTLVQDIHKIHTKYGPFVRVAPNEISVAHPEGWNDIYCRRPGHLPFPKNPIWWAAVLGQPPSIVSAPTPEDHKRMRDLLSHCFAPKALQAQEVTINHHVRKFIEQLREQCLASSKRVAHIDIVEWFSFVMFDITGDLSLAESFDCLDNNGLNSWLTELFSYGKVGVIIAALRHYSVLFKIFLWSISKKDLQAYQANYNWSVEKTHRRLNAEVQREDWMKYILQNSNEETQNLSTLELESNMNLMVFAGSDTCTTVLAGTVNCLIKTPHALKALVHEIRSTYHNASEMSFLNLQRLPYLKAVIEEGLRMCPPNPSGLQHIVPEGGDTVLGQWLPAGVSERSHLASQEYRLTSKDSCSIASAVSLSIFDIFLQTE
jgi:cytochrome P450